MSTNRFSLIIAVSVIAALAVLSISMITAPRTPLIPRSYDASDRGRAAQFASAAIEQAQQLFRAGERGQEYVPQVSANTDAAYLNFRSSESTAATTPSDSSSNTDPAYLVFRSSEWTASNPGVASANTDAAYLNHRRGEWAGK